MLEIYQVIVHINTHTACIVTESKEVVRCTKEITTGSKQYPTPIGTFPIQSIDAYRSTIYLDYLNDYGQIALHPHLVPYHPSNYSHGCVRMPEEFIQYILNNGLVSEVTIKP